MVNMGRSITIYLVDDDDSARKGLAKFLTAAGYNVEAFSSFEDFLKIQLITPHAFLIIDAWVSGLAVTDLQAAISQKNANIPVIFLSVRDDNETRNRAIAAKAAGLFRKPIDGPALLDAIVWEIETQDRGGSA